MSEFGSPEGLCKPRDELDTRRDAGRVKKHTIAMSKSMPASVVAIMAAIGLLYCSDPATTSSPDPSMPMGGAGAGAGTSQGGDPQEEAGGQSGAPSAGGAGVHAEGGSGGSESDGGAAVLGSGGAGGAVPVPEPQGGAASCEPIALATPLAPGNHVATCSAIVHATNPPSSGEHYPVWADFGVYDFPLPRGYWVHNLEHGAVVVSYNCAECDQELSAAETWLSELEPDAACPSGPPRVLLLPDPLLDVRWAASAWGFTLRSSCFDERAFSAFYAAHVGASTAPESSLCGAGVDFRQDGVETCGAK